MTKKYYCLNRPPGIGRQPEGHVGLSPELPKVFPDDFKRGHFGTVEYPQALPFLDIWKYDLFPTCLVEQVCYIAWQDNDRDPQRALNYLKFYFDLPLEKLEENVDLDMAAFDVKRLLDAGHAWSDIESVLQAQLEVSYG